MMLRIEFKLGRDGRHRWFAMRDDRTAYSGFPHSFGSEQQAWEHAEWALGASVEMLMDSPPRFEQHAQTRNFTTIRS